MIQIEQLYSLFLKSGIVCTDSRRVSKNSIFFALSGDNFNGNLYAEEALSKGCSYAVVDDIKLQENPKCIYVKDSLKALQELSNFHRTKLGIPILAITGSNGKTTTKELVSTILAQKYRVAATKGNLNNHIGVPLTLLSMNNTIDFGVVELGASSAGEIANLCEICAPNFGIITNVGHAHIEGFGSFEGVMQAKAEMYEYFKKNNGIVFLNQDSHYLSDMIGNYSYISYGKSKNAYCNGTLTNKDMYVGVKWACNAYSGLTTSNLFGNYNFENILAAITIGNYFNIAPSIIDKTISSYIPRNNRSQLISGRRNQLILDYYNANPTSMIAAIDNFTNYRNVKKGLILGDMLELGKESIESHHNILNLISQSGYEDVFLVGSIFGSFKDSFPFKYFIDSEQLANYFIKHPISGRMILVKGSRSIKLERCTDYL